MAARAKITMSPEEYLAGLKKLEAETNKSANKMENSFKAYGTSINKAGIAMRYVSAEMGAGSVAVGRLFQVLAGGKIAIAVAAVTGAITGLAKAWDVLTVSAKEYQAKLRDQVEAGEKNIAIMRRTQDEEDAMLGRLQELAKRENRTNEETGEQIKLAEILASRYGKLGVSVSDLTGNYESLIDSVKILNEEQRAQREKALEDQHARQSQLIASQFEQNVKPGFWGSVWNAVKFSSEKSAEMKTADFRSMLPAQQRDLVQSMQDAATTDEEREKWKSLLDMLDKQVELHDRLNHLRRTGFETDKDELAAEKEKAEAARRAQDAEDAAHRARVAEIEEEMRLEAEKDKKASEAYQKRIQEEEKLARAAQQRRYDDIASLRFMVLRKQGKGEQAAIEEALYSETKNQGRELDDATRKDVIDRARVRYALENLQTAPTTTPELYAPRVNSLIARGGSAAPMKLPKVEEYQAKTLNSVDTIARRLGTIQNKIDDWGLT